MELTKLKEIFPTLDFHVDVKAFVCTVDDHGFLDMPVAKVVRHFMQERNFPVHQKTSRIKSSRKFIMNFSVHDTCLTLTETIFTGELVGLVTSVLEANGCTPSEHNYDLQGFPRHCHHPPLTPVSPIQPPALAPTHGFRCQLCFSHTPNPISIIKSTHRSMLDHIRDHHPHIQPVNRMVLDNHSIVKHIYLQKVYASDRYSYFEV